MPPFLMYLSSLPFLWEKSEFLRDVMNAAKNDYDVSRFTDPLPYVIKFDITYQGPFTNQGIVVHISDSETKKGVWTIIL